CLKICINTRQDENGVRNWQYKKIYWSVLMTTILFDVDGVFLSEERCFDVSALTVEELLYSPRYLNLDGRKFRTDYTNEEISRIRSTIFADDRVLKRFKEAGLNSNWDM